MTVLLVAVLAVGCGKKRGSSAAGAPHPVDAGASAMTGGAGGPTPGASDASSGAGGDAPGGVAVEAGPGDRAGGETATPPPDGPRPSADAAAIASPDAGRGPVDLPPPPMTGEFHQTLPLLGAVLTSRSPTFGWTDPGGFEYFVVDICRDPSCNDLVERGFSGLTAYSMQGTLDEGKVYWKVRAMQPMGRGAIDSPVWYAHVPARTSMRDTSMLAFPDFNRDGFVDLARASQGSEVQVTSFGSLPPPPPVILPGPALSLANGVDVNADGYGDLLVGREGAVDVYYGGVLGLRLVSVLTGGAGFGARLAGVGDVDGNGFADVLVGTQPDGGAGSATLFLSGRSGLGKAAMTLPLGRVAPAGDVNADGFADVVACSPAGAQASLYVGGPRGLTLAGALVDPRGLGVAVSYGNACQGVGDVNGDGFGDVVITGGGQPLAAMVFLGAETGVPVSTATINVTGSSAEDLYVSTAGDVNRDGYTDLVLTSDAVRVYHGGAGGLNLAPATIIPGEFRVAAGLGDITRDFTSDLVLLPRACDQPAVVYPGSIMGVVAMPVYTVPAGTGAAAIVPCSARFLAR
jgi:hypothetical protein